MLTRNYYTLIVCLVILLGSCKTVHIPVKESIPDYYPAKALLELPESQGKAPSGFEPTADSAVDTTFMVNALPKQEIAPNPATTFPSPLKSNYADTENYVAKLVDEPQNELPFNHNALLGFALVFFGLSTVILPIIGFILCLRAVNQIKAEPEKYRGKGIAMAGIILFIIYIVALFFIITGVTGLINYDKFF